MPPPHLAAGEEEDRGLLDTQGQKVDYDRHTHTHTHARTPPRYGGTACTRQNSLKADSFLTTLKTKSSPI